MTNSIIYNAYHVLGLPTTATQRDILRKAKELQNLFKIDEIPSYNVDFLYAKKIRNEDTVKEALQNLSNPKKRIKEYFFWFQLTDAIDEEVSEDIKIKSYSEAINKWKSAAAIKTNSNVFLYKKNLAVLLCLLLSNENIRQSSYLSNSLDLWKEMVNLDRFWAVFSQNFKLYDDLNTSREIVDEFKGHVQSYLADIYTEISQIHHDNSFFSEFSEQFGVQGEKAKADIVDPIYNEIYGEIAKLNQMRVITNKIQDDQYLQHLRESIQQIQVMLNKLIDLGIYENSESEILRDKVAAAIRSVVLDLYNNNKDSGEKSKALLDVIYKISGSVGMKDRIQEDLDILEINQEYNNVMLPLNELIKDEKFEEALDYLDNHINTTNSALNIALNSQKKQVLSRLALTRFNIGKDEVTKAHYDNARNLFIDAGNLVYQNLKSFEGLNSAYVEDILKQTYEIATGAKKKTLTNIDNWRFGISKNVDEKLGLENADKYTLLLLIDCVLWCGLMPLFKKIKHNTSIAKGLYTVGWITVWFYGIGIIFFIAGAIYDNKN